MKQKIEEKLQIPEGITCEYKDKILTCKKDSLELKREIRIPTTNLIIKGNELTFDCKAGNKNQRKLIMTFIAHVKNMFSGLQAPFQYKLESANVHFPMSLKVESDFLIINNFLGEKIPRQARILPNVNVEIKGQEITISSPDKEAAGQTAANFEKATVVKKRDKRVFQDGIYIIEKPQIKKEEIAK